MSEKIFKSDSNGRKRDKYIEASRAEVYDDNHVIVKAIDKVISNDNLLIVLTNNRMVSTSEMMIDGLHYLKNIVFIAMTILGCLNSFLMFDAYLDNSNIPLGLQIYLGNLLTRASE